MGPFVETIFKRRASKTLLEKRNTEIKTCVERYRSSENAWKYSLDNEPKIKN